MSLAANIAGRKSVRAYLDKPVSDEEVDLIVEAGRWAPNSGGLHLTVLRDPVVKKRVNDATLQAMVDSGVEFLQMRAALPGYQPLYGAPVAILVSGSESDPNAGLNCALAAGNMLTQAPELGLGSCFIVTPGRAFRADEGLAREAGVPEGYSFVCAVLLGHPAGSDPYSDPKRERKGTLSFVG